MEDTERPPKRPHTEPDASSLTEIVQGDPWMSDGSIVLRAVTKTDDQTTHTLWKVHKAVLSYHSSFFLEMFGGPHGSTMFDNASEQHDGVPVMDMQDDAGDVAQFLKALYSPAHLQRHHYTRISFNRLGVNATFPGIYGGILRLAHKYDAKEMHGLVSLSMSQQWPSYWEQWTSVHRKGYLTDNHPNPVHAILLASQYNVPDVLPTAFYDLYLSYERAEGRTYDLSPLDATPQLLHRYIKGRALIRSAIEFKPRRFLSFAKMTDVECGLESSKACYDIIYAWYFQRTRDYMFDPDFFLYGLGRIIEQLQSCEMEEACAECQSGVADMLIDERQKFWTQLPVMFGVSDIVREDWGAQPSLPVFPV
ncbi:hypothetical protein PENSPDRAFT_682898 [Peniophora sp. CONT]|nr:hypothetical protein PENSPDRAFT_682898 [Peniophora sp. CONT]